jgi:hypothetical protein
MYGREIGMGRFKRGGKTSSARYKYKNASLIWALLATALPLALFLFLVFGDKQ